MQTGMVLGVDVLAPGAGACTDDRGIGTGAAIGIVAPDRFQLAHLVEKASLFGPLGNPDRLLLGDKVGKGVWFQTAWGSNMNTNQRLLVIVALVVIGLVLAIVMLDWGSTCPHS
jgi:ABC-type dipeptide/oligopeptide/nickel transport system permease subunit